MAASFLGFHTSPNLRSSQLSHRPSSWFYAVSPSGEKRPGYLNGPAKPPLGSGHNVTNIAHTLFVKRTVNRRWRTQGIEPKWRRGRGGWGQKQQSDVIPAAASANCAKRPYRSFHQIITLMLSVTVIPSISLLILLPTLPLWRSDLVLRPLGCVLGDQGSISPWLVAVLAFSGQDQSLPLWDRAAYVYYSVPAYCCIYGARRQRKPREFLCSEGTAC